MPLDATINVLPAIDLTPFCSSNGGVVERVDERQRVAAHVGRTTGSKRIGATGCSLFAVVAAVKLLEAPVAGANGI